MSTYIQACLGLVTAVVSVFGSAYMLYHGQEWTRFPSFFTGCLGVFLGVYLVMLSGDA
jgi:hypothetical protein